MHKRNTQTVLQMKVLLSLDEAAAVMSVGKTMIADLVRRNELRSIKVGRTRRIPLSSIHEFVSRQLASG
ncbi:MAG: excisionase family DNA-binding protein [Ktedonobacterales bacterium]